MYYMIIAGAYIHLFKPLASSKHASQHELEVLLLISVRIKSLLCSNDNMSFLIMRNNRIY